MAAPSIADIAKRLFDPTGLIPGLASSPIASTISGARGGGAQQGVPAADQVFALEAEGKPVPTELLAQFLAEDPEGYAEAYGNADPQVVSRAIQEELGVPLAADRGDAETGGASGSSTAASGAQKSPAEIMAITMQEIASAMAEEPDPTMRVAMGESLAGVAKTYADLRNLESGSVTLADGTLITSEMLNSADPALRMQYQQAWDQRQADIENASNDILNEYDLASYTVQRQGNQDENARRTAEFSAGISSIAQRLDLQQMTMDQAVEEVDRMLRGKQEARARADLEIKAQEAAAPWASGGKTAFSPADVGMERLAALGGIRDMQKPVITYPGTSTIDPRGAISYYDEQGGVSGAPAPIPTIGINDAEIPRAPSYIGATPAPVLRRPVVPPRRTIQMTPAGTYDREFE